jgi:hypothetical protein
MDIEVDQEITRLYGGPPEDFVGARDALARQLRQQGDRLAAERVRRLRRPSIAAWAVNRAAAQQPALLDELAAAGAELQREQRRALSGLPAPGLRAAMARRRRALDRLVAATFGLLAAEGRRAEGQRQAITATLEAVSVDPEAAAAVRRGVLAHELPPPSGFGEVSQNAAAGLTLVTAPPAAHQGEQEGSAAVPRRGAATARRAQQREARLEAAHREVETARQRASQLRAAATAARQAAERLDGAARRGAERADQLAEQASQARAQAELAAGRARDAHQRAADAEQAAAACHAEVAAAERRLASLDSPEPS